MWSDIVRNIAFVILVIVTSIFIVNTGIIEIDNDSTLNVFKLKLANNLSNETANNVTRILNDSSYDWEDWDNSSTDIYYGWLGNRSVTNAPTKLDVLSDDWSLNLDIFDT